MADERNEIYALIPHPNEARVLVVESEAGWELPRLTHDDAPGIIAEIQARLRLMVTVLGTIFEGTADGARQTVYALDNHARLWTPPDGMRWIGRGDLDGVTEHRDVIVEWLDEVEIGAVPPMRAAWARRGWFGDAAAWIEVQAAKAGYSVRKLEQHYVSDISCVLRVMTHTDDLYFKASMPAFGFEPALTKRLAELWPAHMPHVFAIDGERAWILMSDVGPSVKALTKADGDQSRWDEMLRQYAALQRESAGRVDELLALGLPDWRLDKLPGLYAALVGDKEAMLVGDQRGLAEAEYDAMVAFTAQVSAMCQRLGEIGLPETLHHNDAHMGNVAVRGGDYVFFDWAESAAMHPFCSLFIVLRYAKFIFECDEDALTHLRDAYLLCWTEYAPMERLIEAYDIARRLASLGRALVWHTVTENVEARRKSEYADSAPYWLRLFVNDAEPPE
jgi:hypothetical protein